MIGRLNHVAIAVPDLAAAAAQYEDRLGAKVGAPQDEPDHGVTVIFVEVPNTKIELLEPLGADSPSMRNAEITNGRVAMLAITAYAFEEALTKAPIFPISLFH